MLSPSHYGASSAVPVIGEDSKADAAAAAAAATAAARAKSLGLHTISHSGVTPPLDFSFQDLTSMAELVHHEPAGGRKLPTSPSPASAPAAASASTSLGSPKSVQVLQASSPSHSSGSSGGPKRTGPRVAITGVRLAYNSLADLKGFVEALEFFLGPNARAQLTWLDLSHNKLSEIDEEILLQFPNLTTLYLHGNLISSIQQVRKLAGLTQLSKLTLHGNPIYEPKQNHNLKNPRSALIYHLRETQLRSLDFVTITNADRRNALRWSQQNKPKKKRKTGGEGEEDEREGSPVRR